MKKNLVILALALGLPSTILGVFILIYQLVQNHVINWTVGLIILLAVIGNTLFLMIKYVIKRKN
ncbi:MAG: hypothetical protein JNM93_09815 [Bacteriovoracaceae bacterium]|nr:hypothetical protein [Bacteriovoracaceae bacterium]